MKILHIADIHLGAEPDKDKPWGAGRGNLQWDAFAMAIQAAEQQKVDLLLIAGDLFHRQPLKRELKEVNYMLSRLTRAKVVLMAGNHDYISASSFYRSFDWNENIFFLESEEMKCIEFPELSAFVYGFSYEHREIRENRYCKIEKQGRGYHILLAHGGDETHVPISLRQLKELEFDYIAMGHIHKPQQLLENRIVMAGALQPLDCNETGSHGYWITELKKGEASTIFYPIRGCEYVEVEICMEKHMTNRQLQTLVQSRIEALASYQLAYIKLTGIYEPELAPDVTALEAMERVAKVDVLCKPDYDFDKLKGEYSNQILGRYISKIEQMPQSEITRRALYLGVEALMSDFEVY